MIATALPNRLGGAHGENDQHERAARSSVGGGGAGGQPGAAQRTAAAVRAAAHGRFAARFRNDADPRAQVALAARLNGWAPRNAWRRHVRDAFVPWLGPVFWPYALCRYFH
jgi:hypothetical protein